MATPTDTPRRKFHDQFKPAPAAPAAPATETPQADEGPRKSTRKPFGAMMLKLAYPDRVGFHRHWFNETAGRIQRAQEAGYEHVTVDGKPISKVVGTAEGGGALNAFLMEIPEEWYNEDMAAQQREIDEKEKSIKERNIEGSKADQESIYGKVSIGQGQ